ncbi:MULTISPECIES: TIGR03086 family metal-binding protein [Streptomyces]|uniref:TIGR03086 family metal-binding protein n=1 Tax=Streptomyces TaxID=1883 RepID=UPI002248D43A|nr:TIGR03086 family metal-binding protein [Streptomyces sp. JHD 1]MCX2971170.1 TIGR03086 family metal-binding protein [Streptomyces sp. JHD 1]
MGTSPGTRGGRAVPPLPDGPELLERAIGYALGAVAGLRAAELARATPCRAWDLRTLLRHLNESLTALQEGVDTGEIALAPAAEDAHTAADPATAFRRRAGRLLAAWTAADRARRAVALGGSRTTTSAVTGAGALEIAVHGWDVHRARGRDRPVPPALAADLLRVAPLLVPPADRAPLFDAPRDVPPGGGPGERLVAYLGRDPGARAG